MPVEVVKIEGLAGVLETLKQLPPEVVSKNGGPVRSALRKAAKVLQQRALENLDAVIAANAAKYPQEQSTGLLRKNLVLTRGRRNNFNGESMLVRIRQKKYPGRSGRGATTAQVGRLLETGSEHQPPNPYMAPAFAAKKDEAVAVFVAELRTKLDAAVKRLAKANGVKS